jgi:hypothetical protein
VDPGCHRLTDEDIPSLAKRGLVKNDTRVQYVKSAPFPLSWILSAMYSLSEKRRRVLLEDLTFARVMFDEGRA